MKEKKLYILTYDHGGYVLWADRVKPRLKEIYKWMEKYPKLKIGLDYESFTFDEFSQSDPEIVEMIKDLLQKYPDRIGLGATTYGQPLSLTISEESNARQLIYAVKTNKHYFGMTPNVYAISEFALNNQTPQLIKLCGYEAAILRSHVMGYGYPRTFDSAWGNWVGKDKTAIPAVPTYDKQGRGFNCCTVDNWILSRWPENQLYSLEDFEEMFKKYSPVLASRYDDLTQEIEELTAYTQNKDNYEYVLLEDILEIYGKAEDELVTTDNDFHVQMPWGYCGNEIFNGVRKAEVEAVQAEKLNAFALMLGCGTNEKKLEEAWKYALVAQHHDVTICGLLDLARRFIPASLDASSKAKEDAVKKLATLFADPEKDSILAINTHSFDIDEWVDVDGKQLHIKLPGFTASHLTESDNKKYTYEWDAEKGELTTPCYKFVLTDYGIASIYDIKNKRFIADNKDSGLFSACIDEKMCTSLGKWNIALTDNGAVATQTGCIGTINYKFEMRFCGERARIDCKTQFELHGEKVGITGNKAGLEKSLTVDGHIHEGKICLNLNLNLDSSRRMLRDLPYSISDWSGDIRVVEDYWYKSDRIIIDEKVSQEQSFNNTTQINGIYWLALSDSKYGFAVMNKGCMGGEVRGNRLSVPLLYSNIYLCGDRILEGTYDDEFALLPFESTISDADLHRLSVSYAYNPAVIPLGKGNGKMKDCTFINFDSCGGEVILTTVYPENGNLLARFCNYSDDAASVVLKSAFGTVTEETDLLSQKIKDVSEGKLYFRPWEIKTVKIEL